MYNFSRKQPVQKLYRLIVFIEPWGRELLPEQAGAYLLQ